jgi:hypothetical protein
LPLVFVIRVVSARNSFFWGYLVLNNRAGDAGRRPLRSMVVLGAAALSFAASVSTAALAGAEPIAAAGSGSYDSATGQTTTTGGGSGAGMSCSVDSQSTSNGAGTGGAGGGGCTTPQGSCSASGGSAVTSASTGGSSATTCTTPQGSCSAEAGSSSAPGATTTGAGDCRTIDEPYPWLSIGDERTPEGNVGSHAVTFTVTLSKAVLYPVSVKVATADGSATAGSNDYEQDAHPVVVFPGTTTATFAVTVNGDRTVENDETFTVALSGPQPSGVTITRGTATGTIVNDDVVHPTPAPSPAPSPSSTPPPSGGTTPPAGGAHASAGADSKGNAHANAGGSASAPSSGPPCVVPDVRGKTLAQATTALKAAHCRRAPRVTRYSNKYARGRVVNSLPRAGQQLPSRSRVGVIVSRGPRPKLARRILHRG